MRDTLADLSKSPLESALGEMRLTDMMQGLGLTELDRVGKAYRLALEPIPNVMTDVMREMDRFYENLLAPYQQLGRLHEHWAEQIASQSRITERLYGPNGTLSNLLEPFKNIQDLTKTWAVASAYTNLSSPLSQSALAGLSTEWLAGKHGVSKVLREAAERVASSSPSFASMGLLDAARRAYDGEERLALFNDHLFELADEVDAGPNEDALQRPEILVERLVEYAGGIAAHQSSAQRLGLFEQLTLLIGIVTLILTVWAQVRDDSASQMKDANATLTRIEEGIGRLQSLASPSTIPSSALVVKRTMYIHSEQSMRSPITGIAVTGSLVDVLQREKKWALIRTFDHLSGVVYEGWMRKKYLGRPR